MATGTSIFLIAVGAILAFAIDAEVAGIDITTVGVILLIAGTIGIVVSLAFADRFAAMGTRRTVVEDREGDRDALDGRSSAGGVVETRTTTRERR